MKQEKVPKNALMFSSSGQFAFVGHCSTVLTLVDCGIVGLRFKLYGRICPDPGKVTICNLLFFRSYTRSVQPGSVLEYFDFSGAAFHDGFSIYTVSAEDVAPFEMG